MIAIRHATENDIPLIRNLCLQIWPQTYRSLLLNDQIEFMLEWMYSETSLMKQIVEEHHHYLLVYNQQLPIGYASFSELEMNCWKLHRLYILPSQQGKGIGKMVVDFIIEIVKKNKGQILKLQVHRKNNAKFFYERMGFIVTESADFDIGNGYFMTDYVMEKTL